MIFLYNILQLLLFPLLIVLFLFPEKRAENLRRLGVRFHCRPKQIGRKTFLIHTDSAAEISSALLLIKGLKQTYPDAEMFFSTVSLEDDQIAKKILGSDVDSFVLIPLDFRFCINRFLKQIDPDLCILVNSTVQPNFYNCLQSKKIPAILVNFRVSAKKFKKYKHFSFFYKSFFSSISSICVQADNDRQKLGQLGVNKEKIHICGNIKFDTAISPFESSKDNGSFTLPEHTRLLLAYSIHEGEEESILQCFKKLKTEFPDIYLLISPYRNRRGPAIHRMAAKLELRANLRSQINVGGRDLLILDTSDELFPACSEADIAFVGGSMVDKGGHNPVEPAIRGIPVLFGYHMENFYEISGEMVHAGGGILVRDQIELLSNLEALLRNQDWLQQKGAAALNYCLSKQGVLLRYLNRIQEIL